MYCPVCNNFIDSKMRFCVKCGVKLQTSNPFTNTREFDSNTQIQKPKPRNQKDPHSKRGIFLSLISIAISLVSLGWGYFSYLNNSGYISYYPSFEEVIPPFIINPMLSIIGMIILLAIFSITFLLIIFAFKSFDQVYNSSSRNKGLFISSLGGILSALSFFVVLIYLIAFLLV